MNVSDYIVSFLAEKGIHDLFGYQGTMIAYFVDAIGRNSEMNNHSCYNEQGAAFAACGYAQASGKCGVAYATSGPGAVNLLSGVANAYFDSIPTIFITGQLNTYEYLNVKGLRQQGFQEIDIVSMAKPVTKYTVQITDATRIRYELEKAWYIANHGRAGSVLLDIPMNLQRTEINPDGLEGYDPSEYAAKPYDRVEEALGTLETMLSESKRPVLYVGNGVRLESYDALVSFSREHSIPVATSLLAKGLLAAEDELSFGYVGTYGVRAANLIACAKADLIISIGISLCPRQIGLKTENFAPEAKLFRVDADPHALSRRVKDDEKQFYLDSTEFIRELHRVKAGSYSSWLSEAGEFRKYYTEFDEGFEEREPNRIVESFSAFSGEGSVAVSDVGQHMMWVGQSYRNKQGQAVLFSGGHGAMGYSLPAAIGAYYATGKPVFCVCGDGSLQMNIQELQWVVREKLPIKLLVMNNRTLAMIRFQQTDYFEKRYEGSSEGYSYLAPDFNALAKAYGIRAVKLQGDYSFEPLKELLQDNEALLIEVVLTEDTCAYPKTFLGQQMYNQRPYIPEEKLKEFLEQ